MQEQKELQPQVNEFITALLRWGKLRQRHHQVSPVKITGGFSAREQEVPHELAFVKLFEAKATQGVSRIVAEWPGSVWGTAASVSPELGHPPAPSGLLWEAAADRQAWG